MHTIPLQSRLPKTYRIKAIKRETENVRTFTFPVSLGAKPGQFVMVWLPGVDEVPMSVAEDNGKQLKITFFAIGDTTKKLAECAVGDLVGLRGPFGTHYQWKPKERLVLVAGGYGAAPMYFAAEQAAADGCTLDIFIGAKSKGNLLYVRELGALRKTKVHISTDDGSMGFKGHNVAHLEECLRNRSVKKPHWIFACGPERMLKAVSDLAADRKIPSQLSLERYMKCGFGLCGNCTVDPLGIRLCTDGPVVGNELCRKIKEFGVYHRDSLGRKHAL